MLGIGYVSLLNRSGSSIASKPLENVTAVIARSLNGIGRSGYNDDKARQQEVARDFVGEGLGVVELYPPHARSHAVHRHYRLRNLMK